MLISATKKRSLHRRNSRKPSTLESDQYDVQIKAAGICHTELIAMKTRGFRGHPAVFQGNLDLVQRDGIELHKAFYKNAQSGGRLP